MYFGKKTPIFLIHNLLPKSFQNSQAGHCRLLLSENEEMNTNQIFCTPANDIVFNYLMSDVEIRKSVLRASLQEEVYSAVLLDSHLQLLNRYQQACFLGDKRRTREDEDIEQPELKRICKRMKREWMAERQEYFHDWRRYYTILYE